MFTDLISCNALEFIHLSMVVTHDSQSRRSWLYFNVVLFLKPFNSLNLPFEYLPMEAIEGGSLFGKIQNVGLSYIILSGSMRVVDKETYMPSNCLKKRFQRRNSESI